MKRYLWLYIGCFLSVILLSSLDSHGYRASAHRAINGTAVNQKILSVSGPLKEYFAVQLGYSSATSKVNGKYINKWFEDAGAQEDEPGLRTPNHFLDPISNEAIVGSYDPTAVWAQKEVGQQSPGDPYSWQDGREYFYTALISDIGATREENLTKSFRALGQVMHLVADMSVPEHTRDNSHITIYTIEKWAEEAFNKQTNKPFFKNYSSRLNRALNNPVPPDPSLLKQVGKFVSSKGISAPIPIANLYDFGLYTGSNPGITTTGPIGLAEYTNANFFSRNTIFKDYDYPAKTSTEDYEETDEESGKPMKFIRKIKDGELVNHLAQANVFHKYLPIVTNAYTIVNDKIYADYLEKLLPHAVGYAGALVNYFYRGTMNATTAPGDITFRSIKITATNSTPNETMGFGDISLVIRYKALTETDLGGGKYKLNYPSADYSYKVITLPDKIDLSTPKPLTFDFGDAPLPMNFADMTMQLVFKGKLGNEDGAVAVSKLEPINGIYTDFALFPPPAGVYAKTSDSDPVTASFNELRVTALTDIPGGLSGGTISLALEYRTAIGDQFLSVLVDTNPIDAAGYIYRTPAKNGVNTLPQGVPVELAFDLPQLPVQATDVEINVIFTRADGTQDIGIRNISEPTPVDIYNNTDYTCINNTWYRYDDPVATAILYSSNTYPQNIINISYLAAPARAGTLDPVVSNTLSDAGPLPSGQNQRLGYILTDYTNSYAFSATKAGNGYYPPLTTIPQTNPGLGFRNDGEVQDPMFVIRGTKMWGGNGVVFTNHEYPSGSDCTWEDLNLLAGQ